MNVVQYDQSPTNCLQFVYREETEVTVTDLVIVDFDELTVSSSMIEVTDEVYHMIVDHRIGMQRYTSMIMSQKPPHKMMESLSEAGDHAKL